MAQRGERTDGRTDGQTDGRMDVRTENLPILQDFVPYRGRCPASQRKIYANKEKQGKGIADHLMPLGDWLGLALLWDDFSMGKLCIAGMNGGQRNI